MHDLYRGIDLGAVTTSMTINGPAAVIFAMFVAQAEANGVERARIGGTLQNDILKEYQAQKEFIFPPRPSLRLVRDSIAFCTAEMPRFHPISISGYHIREAGSTAAQELAFTVANGFAYVELALRAGLPVDAFAPRLSFFFNAHNDFFEEIAKYRAARRIWAKVMSSRYGAKSPESLKLRFHSQTAGVTLTAQQPYNNVARVAIQSLAAVLGGTQSLHANALDETLALPTEFAAKIAVRTQQILLHETGVANTIDPLGGSYYVEELTRKMEQGALDYFAKIDSFGGMVEAIEAGYPQKEIMDAAYRFQRAFDAREKVMVGVNGFTESVPEDEVGTLVITEETAAEQLASLAEVRRTRDARTAMQRLTDLKAACRDGRNVMPPLLEAVKAYATVGEISDVMREVFATYEEPAVF
jgi:methylmalonyl-CoA mutase N-terminal domain/subunit